MVLMKDTEVASLLEEAKKLPEVAGKIRDFERAWAAAGLPARQVDADLVGAVFVDGPEEPLLSEAHRKRAKDPALFQLVWLDPDQAGLAVSTFATRADADAKLASLKKEDELGEGGGVLFQGGKIIGEKLFLKYMEKEDFADFLSRATEEPSAAEGPAPEAKMDAVVQAAADRLDELTRLAPQVGKLRREYEVKAASGPEPIYGKPSPALMEFARLFPQYVTLGGCMRPP